MLYTIRNGNQQEDFRDFRTASSLSVVNLPFFNNFGDMYSVIALAKGYKQAGFPPVHVAPNLPQQVDLMLLSEDGEFSFAHAWDAIQAGRPSLARLLDAGVSSPAAARDRFTDLYENQSPVAACLLNPYLHRAFVRFGPRGFKILSYSLDVSPSFVKSFQAERWPMPWLHAWDSHP